ncbi:MAG: DUF433 domain-containing protein [Thermoplasmatota archaeon]
MRSSVQKGLSVGSTGIVVNSLESRNILFLRCPRIAGTRVRVIDVVESYQDLGWSLEKIADQYGLDIEEVLEAMKYYYQNPRYSE